CLRSARGNRRCAAGRTALASVRLLSVRHPPLLRHSFARRWRNPARGVHANSARCFSRVSPRARGGYLRSTTARSAHRTPRDGPSRRTPSLLPHHALHSRNKVTEFSGALEGDELKAAVADAHIVGIRYVAPLTCILH